MKTDMKFKCFVAVVICALWCGSALAQSPNTGAQALNQEMSGLAGKLNKALAAQKFTNVAAVDFTDLQGQPTELGRFLSEQLTVEMVLTEGVSMLDRANIKSILAEHKLTEEGLVNPANAKKLGEFAGVDAILIGNVTALDDGIVLMVKAISTASAKIVAAGRITFPKTSEIQQLLNRGISSSAVPSTATTASGSPSAGASYQSANAIATKDVGSLRVVLKSVLPMKVKDKNGRSGNGVKCSFEFINRETQKPIVVALNAAGPGGWLETIGDTLRTTLVDDRGVTWSLPTSSVTGIGLVGVGRSDVYTAANPVEIGSFLQRRDEMGTSKIAFNQFGDSYEFVFGSTKTIGPGEMFSVTMSFIQDASETRAGLPPKFFQFNSEIVVGIVTAGTKKSYSLQNLIFDRVGTPVSP